MKDTYSDIINIEYHGIKTRKISVSNRAAQFSPFAALTGHEQEISETARLTDERIVLSPESKEKLDLKLSILKEIIQTLPIVKITYFIRDGKKNGGSYQTIIGKIKKIDEYTHSIIMSDKKTILIKDIYEMENELFW